MHGIAFLVHCEWILKKDAKRTSFVYIYKSNEFSLKSQEDEAQQTNGRA